MLVAIDGLTTVGKTSISKLLGEKLNYPVFNSGNIYRLITLDLVEHSLTPTDIDEIITRLPSIKINITSHGMFLNGKDVTSKLEDEYISLNALNFSTIKEVKDYVRFIQKEFIKNNKDLIMEGRDIAERIMPTADIKFYLYASTDQRSTWLAKKRPNLTTDQLIAEIAYRDKKDIESKNFLKPKTAIEIDTGSMTQEEVVHFMLEKIKNVK